MTDETETAADHDAFDLLEALADRMEANGDRERAGCLRACFARGTGGIGPIENVVDILAGPDTGAPAATHLPRGGRTDALGLRPKVLAFAHLMEAKLRENDYKGGWQKDKPSALLKRLREEADELDAAIQPGTRGDIGPWRGLVGNEAADVANFAMMVADVCGGLDDTICADISAAGDEACEHVEVGVSYGTGLPVGTCLKCKATLTADEIAAAGADAPSIVGGLRLLSHMMHEMRDCGTWDRVTMDRVVDNVDMAVRDMLPSTVMPDDVGCLTMSEQKAQATRCSCRGVDEWCPCQNTPDRQTMLARCRPQRTGVTIEHRSASMTQTQPAEHPHRPFRP